MTDVAKDASRIIVDEVNGAVVDSTNALLVEDILVIIPTGDEVRLALEFAGRVAHTEDVKHVLSLFNRSEAVTLINMLLEAVFAEDPGFAHIVQKIVTERRLA